jgi:ribosomal protein S18 acetylase RimI-like enzyme
MTAGNDTGLSIREARPDDLETLFVAQLQMASESEGISLDQGSLRSGLNAALNNPSLGQYWIAEASNGVFAGTLLVTYEWSDWRNGSIWWIQSVFVEPRFRRRGVFRALYQFLQKKVIEAKGIGLRLYVERDNEVALQVYRSLGMNSDRYFVCEWLTTNH